MGMRRDAGRTRNLGMQRPLLAPPRPIPDLSFREHNFAPLTLARRGCAAVHDLTQTEGAANRPHAPESYR